MLGQIPPLLVGYWRMISVFKTIQHQRGEYMVRIWKLSWHNWSQDSLRNTMRNLSGQPVSWLRLEYKPTTITLH